MFKYKTVQMRLMEMEQMNAAIKEKQLKDRADMEYLAMMSDIELDEEEEEDAEEQV